MSTQKSGGTVVMQKFGEPGKMERPYTTRCKFNDSGLDIPEGLTYEEWEQEGIFVRTAAKASLFWLGDWINYGERNYGEKYAQAMDLTDYSYQTLRNVASVCRLVDPTVRAESKGLSYTHHAAVASLLPDQQIEVLRTASDNHWSVTEMKAHMKESLGVGKDNGLASLPKKGLEEIRRLVDKVKYSAIPTTQEVQRMVLCIQDIRKTLREYGV